MKYVPEIYEHMTDKEGNVKATNKIKKQAKWKAKLESRQDVIVNEQFIIQNFGEKFINKCKQSGDKHYVPIPVGSCQSSVLSLVPNLWCEEAPRVKYQQGYQGTCVFSLLTSALYYTGISRLKALVHDLYQPCKQGWSYVSLHSDCDVWWLWTCGHKQDYGANGALC